MNDKKESKFYYLPAGTQDALWGMVVTTVGNQFVGRGGSYPLSGHPENYDLREYKGRVLDEYQLVYVTRGSGYFVSASCGRQEVRAGTMIVLFPDEWHYYSPDQSVGWDEYWVGFRGSVADSLFSGHFFSREEPLLHIGVSATIVGLYENMLSFAEKEKSGYQQMISGIVMHIMGCVYYKLRNQAFVNNTYVVDKINEACIKMRECCGNRISCEEIARDLSLGYSWFRQMFKQYTGISPAQYMMQHKILRAKNLLVGTKMNISEIAYMVGFENVGQFATFFKKKVGMSPSEYRSKTIMDV